MTAVDVGVGHHDDAVIARLFGIEILAADAGAEGGDQGADLGRAQHLVEARALDVQDLAAERQDGLEAPVAALFRRAAGGIALDDENLRQRRIAFLAIGQLAGQRGDVERALAARQLARLARRFAGERVAFRLAPSHALAGLESLWARELLTSIYRPCWLTVTLEGRAVTAISFVVKKADAQYAGALPAAEQAAIIAAAQGKLGSCRDYLANTVAELAALGIDEPWMTALLREVDAIAARNTSQHAPEP